VAAKDVDADSAPYCSVAGGEGAERLMLDLSHEADWSEHADRIEALGAERISDNEQHDGVPWAWTASRPLTCCP
jgi:hypothetical protein